MLLEADAILHRRRLQRNLSLWRFAAVVALVTAAVLIAAGLTGTSITGRAHVAELEVFGLIIDDEERDQAIRDLVKDADAKALIISINSPGGTTSGAEGLYLALRELAAHKPVVAVMGAVAASGGYITAISADHIIARGNTITGSIGVLFQNIEVSKLMEKVGVDVEMITSGPLKGKPSPFAPLDAQARAALTELTDDAYQWFLDLVIERRKLSPENARSLSDGRVFSGRMALEAKLIDQIGGIGEARQWLEKEKAIDADLPAQKLEYGSPLLLGAGLADSLASGLTGKIEHLKRLTLDGLISVWHH